MKMPFDEDFSKEILATVQEKPLSLEVFSDDFNEMEKQARKIFSWGKNVYVKIPITNSMGDSSINLIKKLSDDGIKLNITALFTEQQVQETISALNINTKLLQKNRLAYFNLLFIHIICICISINGSKRNVIS